MKKMFLSVVTLGLVLVACDNQSSQEKSPNTENKPLNVQTPKKSYSRIVSLKGAVTEILAKLDLTDNIIGVDVTSVYPAEVNKLPKLGHSRNLSIEGVLALNPDLIIGTKNHIKPEHIDQLKASGVKVELFDQEYSVEGTKRLISQVCETVHQPEKAPVIIEEAIAPLQMVAMLERKPKVMFIYARGAGTLMVAGENTALKAMIELAGGQNAILGFQDYKPLTSEAIVKANPDVIMLFESGLKSILDENGKPQIPGLEATNAGKHNQIYGLNSEFVGGFGPRIGEAALLVADYFSKAKIED